MVYLSVIVVERLSLEVVKRLSIKITGHLSAEVVEDLSVEVLGYFQKKMYKSCEISVRRGDVIFSGIQNCHLNFFDFLATLCDRAG